MGGKRPRKVFRWSQGAPRVRATRGRDSPVGDWVCCRRRSRVGLRCNAVHCFRVCPDLCVLGGRLDDLDRFLFMAIALEPLRVSYLAVCIHHVWRCALWYDLWPGALTHTRPSVVRKWYTSGANALAACSVQASTLVLRAYVPPCATDPHSNPSQSLPTTLLQPAANGQESACHRRHPPPPRGAQQGPPAGRAGRRRRLATRHRGGRVDIAATAGGGPAPVGSVRGAPPAETPPTAAPFLAAAATVASRPGERHHR